MEDRIHADPVAAQSRALTGLGHILRSIGT